MPGSATYSRAERLGALLYLYRGGDSNPLQFKGELDVNELEALGDLTEDDMHLANACLAVEARVLRREFAAVERLLAHGMFGADQAENWLDVLPSDKIGLIASDLLDLMALGLI